VSAGAEADIAAGEAGQLRDAQAGLRGEQDGGVIAATDRGRSVGRGEQRVEFGIGEERDVMSAWSKRLAGIARTRWIVAACSGCLSAAYLNSERIAASRVLRVRMLFARSCSRWSRNAPIWFASDSTPQIRVLISPHLRGFRHHQEGVFDDRAGTFSGQ